MFCGSVEWSPQQGWLKSAGERQCKKKRMEKISKSLLTRRPQVTKHKATNPWSNTCLTGDTDMIPKYLRASKIRSCHVMGFWMWLFRKSHRAERLTSIADSTNLWCVHLYNWKKDVNYPKNTVNYLVAALCSTHFYHNNVHIALHMFFFGVYRWCFNDKPLENCILSPCVTLKLQLPQNAYISPQNSNPVVLWGHPMGHSNIYIVIVYRILPECTLWHKSFIHGLLVRANQSV